MKVTVCQLPNDQQALETAWQALTEHVQQHQSELVLLPEMLFYRWLAYTDQVDEFLWESAVQSHLQWMHRLDELSPATVISTRPTVSDHQRHNSGYVRQPGGSPQDCHAKYYLPNEPGFWEATWYQRGDGSFGLTEAAGAKLGFLICTELWFNQHARIYGQQGAHLIVNPRATHKASTDKWIAGGRAAATVAGAYCLSSNFCGPSPDGGEFGGAGWIIEPEEAEVLGVTSDEQPFLTLDIDLQQAVAAKQSYPRYVKD